jgi:ATP/maltotriose-dependent transcriptional regulator MalT
MSDSPINANDLLQQRLAADVAAMRGTKSASVQQSAPSGIAGDGVTDSAELLRILAMLKQAEASTNNNQSTIVIGEFSVASSRVPERHVKLLQGLSRSEAAVLRLLAWGRSNADIGTLLDMKDNTVRAHMGHMVAKLQLDGTRELNGLAGLLFFPIEV